MSAVKIALFGASSLGRQCLADLRRADGGTPVCFFDNDPAKWGQSIDGLTVRRPEPGAFEAVEVVWITTAYVDQVRAQLRDAAPHVPVVETLFGALHPSPAAPLPPAESRARLTSGSVARLTKAPAEAYAGGATPLRVLMVLHAPESESPEGGPSIRLPIVQRCLARLGVAADIARAERPDPRGYDLVHVFNVWEPTAALEQLRHLRGFDVPIVFSPIYLALGENLWAQRTVLPLMRGSLDDASLDRELGRLAATPLAERDAHGLASSADWQRWPARVAELTALADHLVVLGEHEASALRAIGALERPYDLVRNGAGLDWADGATGDAFRARLGIGDYVLSVGRIEPRKNQLLLARALRDTDVDLVLIGDTPKPEYAELVCRHGRRVHLLGRLDHDGDLLRSAFAGARVFALPSWSEGAPLSALEAAAFGLPLVLSNRSSEREYLGPLATYVDPLDLDAIRDAVCDAWHRSAAERDAHRRALRTHMAGSLSWEHAARATARAYIRAVSECRGPAAVPAPVLARAGVSPVDSPHAAPTSDAKALPPLHWDSPHFNRGGYAALSRHLVRAVVSAGLPLRLESRDDDEQMRHECTASHADRLIWQRAMNPASAGGVYVCHYTPTGWDGCDIFRRRRDEHPGMRAYVGLTVFETDRLPRGWREACDAMDEIWVPSEFNRETFSRSGVPADRVQVIPVGIDASRYDPATVTPLPIAERRGFVFLSVFDWTVRKGWDVLLRAYVDAFSSADDVSLVLRTSKRGRGPRAGVLVREYLAHLGRPACQPHVLVLEEPLAEADMPRLYRAADAFVLPTRGEGWGLPIMEAMASGLPAIVTRWSAHLDFANDANAWLVDTFGTELVGQNTTQQSPYYGADHRWAVPSVDHLSALMRQAYGDPAAARALGARARHAIATNWTPHRSAEWIARRLAALGTRAPHAAHGSRRVPMACAASS